MKIYNEARQNFSTVLNTALKEEVIITRKDGNRFQLVPINKKVKKSPLDIEGIDTDITTQEIIDVLRECRAGTIATS
ncbi:MAG: cysteine desulfurase [Treponema sp.]|jgi:antitoxin (DNA-binding transcriptional repressor) of toxin-antitoxin stability system|nr:cysteine desulfurase [Treponema sp.]